MQQIHPWLRRCGYLAFVVIVMLVVVPSQVISQVGVRNDPRIFLGPLSLSNGQILEVVTSWKEDDCKHCTKTGIIRLWDTQSNLLASIRTDDPLCGRLEVDRDTLPPSNKPIEVVATVDTQRSGPQDEDRQRPSISFSAYDQVTGQTDSLNYNEAWVDVSDNRRRRVLQSCPVGLNGNSAAQVTLVNTQDRPIRAQLLFVNPMNRNVITSLAPEGESVPVAARGSVLLRLDGRTLDPPLMIGDRRTVVAVSQTSGRRRPPLVSIQAINTNTKRTIVSGNNMNMLSDTQNNRNR